MSRNIKINSKIYEKIKNQTGYRDAKDIASDYGVSRELVYRVRRSEDFESYKAGNISSYLKKLREIDWPKYSGEAFFWLVCAELRNYSCKAVAIASGHLTEEIRQMRKAQDWETYQELLQNEKEAPVEPLVGGIVELVERAISKGLVYEYVARELPISKEQFEQIKSKRFNQIILSKDDFLKFKHGVSRTLGGEKTNSLARENEDYLGFSLEVSGIKEIPSWVMGAKRRKIEMSRYLKYENEIIFHIVRLGARNGVSRETMAKDMGVPIELVKDLLSVKRWTTYENKFYPIYRPEADQELFEKVSKGEIADNIDSRVQEKMAQFDDFGDYIISEFFHGEEPEWMKASEESAVDSEPVKSEPIEPEQKKDELDKLIQNVEEKPSDKYKYKYVALETYDRLERFKYKWKFILMGIALLEALILGLLMILE